MSENPWYYYRLSDMVKMKRFRNRKTGRKLHYELYPDSLASQYMKKTDKNYDFDILINLIEKYPQSLGPEKDELVVHLRVGEVINKTKYTVKELLEKERLADFTKRVRLYGRAGRNYVKPLSFYEQHLNKIQKQVKKITLVAGGCKAHNFTKSKEYIQAIKNLFEKSGFDVQVRLGNHPDDDFIYMCRSKLFIPAGGGFSQLVQLCHANLWRSPQ